MKEAVKKGITALFSDTKEYKEKFLANKDGAIYEGEQGYLKIKSVNVNHLPHMHATQELL